MTWLDALVSNIKELIGLLLPWWIIRPYKRGIVFRFGLVHRVMEPGIHWKWPLKIETVEEIAVVEETHNLLSQSVTTKDGQEVTFSVNLSFVITDPVAYYCHVQDFDKSLDAIAMTHLARRVREWTWDELLTSQKELEESLKGTLTTRVKQWGAEMRTVGFTDFVRAKPYRFFGDGGAGQLATLAALLHSN